MESFNAYKKINEQESAEYTLHAIKFLDPQIKTLDSDSDGLLDFEIQTTLEAFIKTKKN